MTNPKGDLIEYCQANSLGHPVFETTASGPEHEPVFISRVLIEGQLRGQGTGRMKREAERLAATAALQALQDGVAAESLENDEADNDNGPWPIFEQLLTECLAIANSRVDAQKQGPSATEEVRRLALDLYKGTLEALGEYT